MDRKTVNRFSSKGFQKGVRVLVIFPADPLPVIKPGTLELAVGQFKTQTPDEDEMAFCRGTQPGDVASVWRNLRFEEDDVEGRILMNPHGPPLFEGQIDESFQQL